MKKEHLSDAIGKIDDDLIEGALKTRSRSRMLVRVVALAACFCLILSAATVILPGLLWRTKDADKVKKKDLSFSKISDLLCAVDLLASYSGSKQDTEAISVDFIRAMSDFSFDVFDELINENGDGNLLFSPTSAAICLSMLTNGAGGETLAQLEGILGMPAEALNRQMYSYQKKLYRNYAGNKITDEGVHILTPANSVWFRDGDDKLVIKDSFLKDCNDFYNIDLYAAPFDDRTVKDINHWVDKRTDGLIPELIREIRENTMLYLINTLYFEDSWELPYEKHNILDGVFKNADGSESAVSMLSGNGGAYLSGYDAKGIVRAYNGTGCSFVGLLPEDKRTDIYEFAASLSTDTWMNLWVNRQYDGQSYQGKMGNYTLNIHSMIPAFEGKSDIDFIPVMEALGVTDMFGSDADLLRLGTYGGESMKVGEFRQKTAIEVTANGTKAAAATYIALDTKSCPDVDFTRTKTVEVNLDRPFVYAIVDNATGLPLFIGINAQMD